MLSNEKENYDFDSVLSSDTENMSLYTNTQCADKISRNKIIRNSSQAINQEKCEISNSKYDEKKQCKVTK
jgi:hypothetical protein